MLSKSALMSALLLTTSVMAAEPTMAGTSNKMAGPDGNMISVQVVQVSDLNATFRFNPEEVKAEPGSMVQFQFYPKVAQRIYICEDQTH
jgi:plastocyanin